MKDTYLYGYIRRMYRRFNVHVVILLLAASAGILGNEEEPQCIHPIINIQVTEQLEPCTNMAKIGDQLSQMIQNLHTTHQSGGALSAHLPRDCRDVLRAGNNLSGVYTVYPDDGLESIEVFCDMATDGGGWTVFQRRQEGDLNFFRFWSDYKLGFGYLDGEHWLGNEKIHRLSMQRRYSLRIDMWDWQNGTASAMYDVFSLDGEDRKYTLRIGAYSGSAGNSLAWHNGKPFSTRDIDSDAHTSSCSETYHGAWWYASCHDSNLNGRYYQRPSANDQHADGVVWHHWKDGYYPLKRVEMKFRP